MNLRAVYRPFCHDVLKEVTLSEYHPMMRCQFYLSGWLTSLLESGLLAEDADPKARMTVKAALKYLKESV